MKKTPLALFAAGFFVSYPLMAEEAAQQANSDVAILEEIQVKASNFSQQIGTQKITEAEMERRPSTNGNITDLLKTNPNVRFSATSESSTSGGEIKPSEVSFHGDKFYNNNFIVNGMSNNDNINPGSDSGSLESRQPSGSLPHNLPGGDTQSFWLDTSLLKSVEAFDSNISAKYGNFTGGVVEAKLKDPSFEKWNSGKVYYRRTQDEWSKFHVDDDSSFKNANRLDHQPEFTKQQYGVMVNQKLSDKASIRFNYAKTESEMVYYHPNLRLRDAAGNLGTAGVTPDLQRRTAETYMLNGIYLPDNGDLWRLNFTYAPHTARYFKANTIDGGFTTTGGGVQANLEWERQLNDSLKMTSFFGYKQTGNKVKHDQQHYHVFREHSDIGWVSSTNGIANQGGFGTVRTEKEIFTAKQDFKVTEFDLGSTQHNIEFGWQADLARAKYVRETASSSYTYEIPSYYTLVCNGAEACLDSQYAWKKLDYYARTVKAKDNAYSAYIQDSMQWGNLNLIGGLRSDYNQYLGKLNLAPRLSASYDLFGDQKTQLFGGLNRYYAGSMLSAKMSQDISNYRTYERNLYTDGTLSDWLAPGLGYISNRDVSKLKNPYSDEVVLGLGQKWLGLDWTFKWVHRHAKEQFTTRSINTNGSTYSQLTNDGWSKNDTYTFTLKPTKGYEWEAAKLNWDLAFSWNKTKTNSRWYNATEPSHDYMIYNGHMYFNAGGAIPQDFNNPYRVSLNVNTEFPKWRLSWDQRFSYVGGKDYIYDEGTYNCNGAATAAQYRGACGNYVGEVNLYKDAHQASHFLVDWRFAYKQPTIGDQHLEFTLDVNNVLNKRAVSKSAGGNTLYKMGRNFWAGVSYNW